jgi:hypothetical protein
MCRLQNCIWEFTTGTIDDAGDDNFLCHIVSSAFVGVLFLLLLFYVKVIPLLKSLFILGYFVFVSCKQFALERSFK